LLLPFRPLRGRERGPARVLESGHVGFLPTLLAAAQEIKKYEPLLKLSPQDKPQENVKFSSRAHRRAARATFA
jgi:hypothetical protein